MSSDEEPNVIQQVEPVPPPQPLPPWPSPLPSSSLPSTSPSPSPPSSSSTPPPALSPYPLNPHQLLLITRPPPTYRGVFTSSSQTLPPLTVIEQAPVLVLDRVEWETHGRRTKLDHYAFVWGRRGAMAVAFGLGSMFNHSPTPNVSFVRDLSTETIRFITAKRIGPNTELTISYGPESALWFAPDYGVGSGGGGSGGSGEGEGEGEGAGEIKVRDDDGGATSAGSSSSAGAVAEGEKERRKGEEDKEEAEEEENAEALLLRLARELTAG